MNIGDRIKKIRTEKLRMSQVDLAKAIGVSKQTLYKYENNIVTNIPSDKIETIARLAGIAPAYLMGWTDDPQDSSDYSQMEQVAQWRENNPYLAEEPQYYTDPDVSRMANELKDRPDLRVLLDASRDLSKDDMFELIDIINRIKDGTWKE